MASNDEISDDEAAEIGFEIINDPGRLNILAAQTIEVLVGVKRNLEQSLRENAKASWMTPEIQNQAEDMIKQIQTKLQELGISREGIGN